MVIRVRTFQAIVNPEQSVSGRSHLRRGGVNPMKSVLIFMAAFCCLVGLLVDEAAALPANCYTLNYCDGSPNVVHHVPGGVISAYAMRFTPVGTDTLKIVEIAVWDPGDGSFGDDTVWVSIYSNASGLPGAMLATRKIAPGGYSAYPSLTSFDFGSLNLVFAGDFHVGVSTSAASGSGRFESILSDSGQTNLSRSSSYSQGAWHSYGSGSGPDYNFFIGVRMCQPICYATGDFNNDGMSLTVPDYSYLASFIGGSGEPPVVLYSCDLNGDGIVSYADQQLYLSYFSFGIGVFAPYGGYPVACLCNPTPSPVPDTVGIFGFDHISAGPTTLAVSGSGLVIKRFMSTMAPEGVTVDIPDAISSPPSSVVWSGELENPDQSGSLPAGASIAAEFRFADDGSAEPYVMSISQTKSAAATWNLAVSCAAVNYSIKAYNNGSQVYSGVDTWTDALGYIVETAKGVYPVGFKGTTAGKPASVVAAAEYDFTVAPNGVRWTWAGHSVTNLQIDYLSISTEIPDTGISGPSSVGIYGREVDSLKIRLEEVSFSFGNVMVTPLGNAVMTPSGSRLIVGNLGSSGQDGLVAEQDAKDGEWSIMMVNPDSSGTFPTGGEVSAGFLVHNAGIVDTFDIVIFRPNKAIQWNLAVRSGISTYTIEAYNNGAKVFTGSDNGLSGLGYVVETAKGVYPVGFKGTTAGKPASIVATGTFDFAPSPSGVQWTWAAHGVSNMVIDELRVSAEYLGSNQGGISQLMLCGDSGAKANPFSLTVTNITFTPNYICGDVDGNGSVSIADVVYIINYIFAGGPAPNPLAAADVDCSGGVSIADAVYIINYIFAGGAAPCAAC